MKTTPHIVVATGVVLAAAISHAVAYHLVMTAYWTVRYYFIRG